MQEIHHKSISVRKHIGGQGCQCANKSVNSYMFVCKQVFKVSVVVVVVSQLLLLLCQCTHATYGDRPCSWLKYFIPICILAHRKGFKFDTTGGPILSAKVVVPM